MEKTLSLKQSNSSYACALLFPPFAETPTTRSTVTYERAAQICSALINPFKATDILPYSVDEHKMVVLDQLKVIQKRTLHMLLLPFHPIH